MQRDEKGRRWGGGEKAETRGDIVPAPPLRAPDAGSEMLALAKPRGPGDTGFRRTRSGGGGAA